MTFVPTILEGCYIIEPSLFSDERGWFARYFCRKEFQVTKHEKEWVQMNHSFTLKKATIRGLHYQASPYKEIKLVRCIAGAVFDVVIDLRKGSHTFLKWFSVELSAKNRKMIYIPEGFAHGFQTLEDNTELLYHHSDYYMPEFEKGIRYDDDQLQINWPFLPSMISSRDSSHPYIEKNYKGI